MLKSKSKLIAITMGDPQGIGPEIIAKALLYPQLRQLGSFLVIGDAALMRRRFKQLPDHVGLIDVPYKNPGEGSLKFLDQAILLIKKGLIKGLCTAPLSKERVAAYAPDFRGHTEYLAEQFSVKHVDMMFVAQHHRVVIVTRHEPLKDIPSLITTKAVYDSIMLTAQSLCHIFKIKKPRIALLGLNPHAGENGLMGKEEGRSIIPAMRKAQAKGVSVFGPFAADTFFAKQLILSPKTTAPFDAIIAMYHDQGLIPMKTLFFKDVVNMTIGLPFVRTCPAHGTAFDIAKKNCADPSSMVASLELACQLV